MLDRKNELEEFKKVNLSLIAAAHGYEIVRKKSTNRSIVMDNGADKIVISEKKGRFVYFSVFDAASNGTAIDFAQKVIEPGADIGRVRQLLRPFLSGGYVSQVEQQAAGKFASSIKENIPDQAAVAARYDNFAPIAGHHRFLCDERGIPAELLASERLRGCLRQSRSGAVIFPHHGSAEEGSRQRVVTGYEIKGPGVSLFASGGTKGLWVSRGGKRDDVLAIGESGLDALSCLALHNTGRVRVASIGGHMNRSTQPKLIQAAMERMEQGSTIVAAMDNDPAGDRLVKEMEALFRDLKRSDLNFSVQQAPIRGQDWNDVAVEQARISSRFRSASLSLG